MKLFLLFLTSLISVLSTATQQEITLQEAKLAVDSLFQSDKIKALAISENQIEFAIVAADTFHITYFLDQAGELNRVAGNYDQAIAQLSLCLNYKVNWEDLKDLSITHNNLGRTYGQKGNFELAVFHFLEALKLMEKAENLLGQSFYLNNLGAMYDLQHNYVQAIEYYERALKIKYELGNENAIAASLTNLGISFYNLGDYPKSIAYLQEAFILYKKSDNVDKWVRTINNMGEAYLKMEEYEKALDYINRAFAMDKALTDEKLRMTIMTNRAKALFYLEQWAEAQASLALAEAMALKANSLILLKEVYALKSAIARQNGQLNDALDYLHLSNDYNDSLINVANINAVAEMRGKYEYEKNQRILAEQERQVEQAKLKVVYWIGSSICLLVLVIVFIVLYLSKQKNTWLLKGQLALIGKQNRQLKSINQEIKTKLNKTQISLEEKEEILEIVFSRSNEKKLPDELISLSKREMEVLSYLALGWSDEQLADKLFVSKSTVKTHLRRIYSKLLVRGRAEAVTIAHKYDLLGEEQLA